MRRQRSARRRCGRGGPRSCRTCGGRSAVGAGLAAAISLGEFGATTFLTRSGGETLPIAIEQLLGRAGTTLQAQGYVLATVLAATTVVAGRDRRAAPVLRRCDGGAVSRLAVNSVRVPFGELTVLDDVSLALERRGRRAARPVGQRQEHLLRVIAGLVAPDAGTVHVDGVDVTHVPTHRRGVGLVFQDKQLFPHLSTLDNVTFGLRMAGTRKPERDEQGARCWNWSAWTVWPPIGHRTVRWRGQAGRAGAHARRAAGGRAAGRAAHRPRPRAARSSGRRPRRDPAHAEVTAVLVTHDRDEAATIADRTVLLADIDVNSDRRSDPGGTPPTAGG